MVFFFYIRAIRPFPNPMSIARVPLKQHSINNAGAIAVYLKI